MRRRNGHREFDCVAKPSDYGDMSKLELVISVGILKALGTENFLTDKQVAQCEDEIRKNFRTQK